MGVLGSLGSKTQHVIELATKLTVIGVPALYFAGWGYLDIYWEEFGIDDAVLGYSSVDYIRRGALVLIQSILGGASWVLVFAWISVAVLIILECIRTFGIPRLFGAGRKIKVFLAEVRRRRRVARKYRELASSIDAIFESSQVGVISFLTFFLFAVGLIYLGVTPSASKAKTDAAKERVALSTFATLERNWVLTYTDAESARPALLLGCGSEMCALLRSERTELIPRSTVSRMETCRRVNRADDGTFRCISRTALL
jgi:hypothetical protein